jgi:hypothetical protein
LFGRSHAGESRVYGNYKLRFVFTTDTDKSIVVSRRIEIEIEIEIEIVHSEPVNLTGSHLSTFHTKPYMTYEQV